MKTEKLGSLECVRVPSRLGEGKRVRRVVVLMHGFGAPGEDLVGLAGELDVPADTAFVFPKAPHSFSDLYGAPPFVDARAWWKLDLERIERARRSGGVRDLTIERPEGLDDARAGVVTLLDALESENPGVSIVIGGFSQGAMLACDTALRERRAFAGLIVLSGALLCEDEWSALYPHVAGVPIFQSHGTDDDVLPYALAERLRAGLVSAGAAVTFVSFSGGHGLPSEVTDGLSRFLQ